MSSRFSLSKKVVAFGTIGLAVVVGGIVALAAGTGGSSAVTLPTTGNYAPIFVPKPATGFQAHVVQGVDPDSLFKEGVDLEAVVARAPGSLTGHRFRITISNTSGIGAVESLSWSPPNGIQIERVIGSSNGACVLTGTKGLGGAQFPTAVANPRVTCTGLHLRPPSCTCRGDGGSVAIEFVANKFPDFAGSVSVDSATPSLKLVPSYVQSPDLPTCSAGQASTTAKPCSSG